MKIKTHCSCGKAFYIGQGFKVPYCLSCDLPAVDNLEAFRNHFMKSGGGAYAELLILVAEIANRPLTASEMSKLTGWLSQTLIKQVEEFRDKTLAALVRPKSR